jgi:hypothetical protein
MSNVEMSPEQLQKILEAVVAKVTRMNPLEQKRYDEELAKERRRDELAVTLGRAEMEGQRAKRDNCSHKRYPAGSGAKSGETAPKGETNSEWCTFGQAYQNGLAMMHCSRCHSEWWFQPTQEYYGWILQNGLRQQAPPPEKDCICIGCYHPKPECQCGLIAKEHVAAHPTAN